MLKPLFLIFFIFTRMAVFAEEAALDIDTSLAYAYKNNLQIKSAGANLESARLTRDTAWNQFVPQISAGLTLSRLNEEQTALLPGLTAPSQWNLQAQLSIQLTLSLNNLFSIRKTILDYEAGMTGFAKAKSALARDIKKQFFSLLLLNEQIKVAQMTYQNAKERYEQAAIDYRNGIISELDYLRSQVHLESTKPAVTELTNAKTNLESIFKLMIGIDPATPVVFSGSLDVDTRELDAEELVSQHLADRFDIIESRAAITIMRNTIDLTASVFYPSLTLGLLFDPTINGPFENDLFDGNNWPQRSGMFSISIRLLIDPLLPASKTRVALENLRAQLDLAEENLVFLRKNAEIRVRQQVRSLASSRASIRTRELNARVAERAFRLAEESYNAGGLDLLGVRDVENDFLQARLSMLQEKYNYLSGLFDLEYELNIIVMKTGESK